MEEAARVAGRKKSRYEGLLGLRLPGPPQVYTERYAAYYPSGLYDSYVAAEAEDLAVASYRDRYTIRGLRKPRTFYYNPLDADGFDEVLDPVVLEPVVQFTLYLKLRYDAGPAAGDPDRPEGPGSDEPPG
ncbi:hypothetical protein ElP_71370 (plasmid) [Tautonia plasticadhaerens]|uniref:Uncharacterized protein n=2 Tax=Tautonia plasticadhaerens TaxID=2527974 RepID=A0A518HEA0_9BACT|nr:hypothetical protein ElP_71370 [Tautonia plasticadhaerens]